MEVCCILKSKSTAASKFEGMSDENIDEVIQYLIELKTKRTRSKHSLAKFADDYIEFIKSSNSSNYVNSVELSFRHLLDYFDKDKSIGEVDRIEAEKFIAKLKISAPKGFRVYYRNLRAAFNVAIDWELITVNPFMKMKLPKKQKEKPAFITVAQLNSILKEIEVETLKDIVQYAFFTGSRRIEILNLRWRNLDFKKKTITIGDEDFETKTKSQRIIPMCDLIYATLWKRSKKGKLVSSKPDGFVFAKANGFPYHEDVPTKAFKRACRKANIDEKIHFHSLRHSFASFLVQNKVELYNVKELLGHSSITTTEIYAHLNLDALEKSIKAFDNIEN